MNLNVTTKSKKISKWRQNVMDCPCEKCPVIPICRQKVFKLMEEKYEERDLRTSIVKFCFDNCTYESMTHSKDCSLLEKYLEMVITENKHNDRGTHQIKTEKMRTVAKALYFDVNELFPTEK
ncbi:MAG: hypothetical protein ACTSX1_15740 [Candidatus Heimdallarchaeaceae archaeon]